MKKAIWWVMCSFVFISYFWSEVGFLGKETEMYICRQQILWKKMREKWGWAKREIWPHRSHKKDSADPSEVLWDWGGLQSHPKLGRGSGTLFAGIDEFLDDMPWEHVHWVGTLQQRLLLGRPADNLPGKEGNKSFSPEKGSGRHRTELIIYYIFAFHRFELYHLSLVGKSELCKIVYQQIWVYMTWGVWYGGKIKIWFQVLIAIRVWLEDPHPPKKKLKKGNCINEKEI